MLVQDDVITYMIVIMRALARIEAQQTGKTYDELIAGYKQEIGDLETFYATG